ncbi:hypothetical protein GCM10011351_26630 [Paraliobacillus quinghaiensis]|uniref:Uncharacterized protein n=1 Tax=Paraliobacillus quinghaiensis TaxID=470815 RepID=A0A917TV10_9BACI|nr:hypothetical protein [Paraliobacillus quinghaiensis]GGM39141.1 hypothetical protein GCM10011351_26630 [Paraliobacillus quinghaiensis]
MKRLFDNEWDNSNSLKTMDDNMYWDHSRKQQLGDSIRKEIRKTYHIKKIQRNMVYLTSLAVFVTILFIGYQSIASYIANHNADDSHEFIASTENENQATTNQIEEKNSEIAKLTEELEEEKKKVEELQKTLEESEHPYYVNEDPEVRSEDNERLSSYAFIIKGIANRIAHIDGLMKEGQYNEQQLDILKREREYVWQLWNDWKDKQKELMDKVEN